MVNEAEAPPPAEKAAPSPASRAWRNWRRGIAATVLFVLLVVGAGMAWLDSPSGHRFVVDRIAALAPESGLKIEIGRIDGSLYSKAVLRDVRLSDPDGLFLSAPEIRFEWWPVAWLSNRLAIDDLLIPRAKLHHIPRFRPSKVPSGKILPDFDIRIMHMRVDALEVDKAVLGRADVFALEGDADIRSGRAVVDLTARALRGDDRLLLALDSRPDANRFDIDLTVNAPADGLIAALAGLKQNLNVRLEGDGDWGQWKGRLVGTLNGQSAAGFDIVQRKGHYHVEGSLAGSAIATKGLLARISSPRLVLVADGRFKDRLLSGQLQAKSDALTLNIKGGVHLGGRGYDNLTLDLGLRRPTALLRNFDARGLVARARFNGPFASARFEYLLRADMLQFGRTRLRGVHAAGEGRGGGKNGVTLIPVQLSAQQIDGQGDLVAQILHRISITGTLQKKGNIVTSSPLKLRSDKLDGTLLVLADLKSGRYDLGLTGDINGLLIPGLGVVDISSRVQAVPDKAGAFSVNGRVGAVMRRLDNDFLRTLGGGLPRLQSDIALGADGRLLLRNLTVRAPLLTLAGQGVRNPDQNVRIEGSGTHERYGPIKRLILTGRIDRPAVDLLLARPLDSAGLADVHVLLDPYEGGYHFRAEGGSHLGPFTGHGDILLPKNAPSEIVVAHLLVNGADGAGRLQIVPGGFAGRLLFDGSVKGPIDLAIANGMQTMKASFRFDQAHFAGAMPIDIRRGRFDGDILFGAENATINASLRGSGILIGGARINRLTANTRLVNGVGKLQANIVGQRGRLFDMKLDADVAPDEIRFALGGTLDQQPIRLDRRARLARIEGGWALDPVIIRYRGGEAGIRHAAFGAETRVDLGVKNLPLSLLDLANVDLGLGGVANGRLIYAQPRGGVATGSAELKIKGLTRSGVTRTSTPVDLGINARLAADRLAMRAVMTQKGATIGRAQALMTPLGAGGLIDRLRAAPVRAQLRYVGPAEALWRMSTIEIVDLTGPIAFTANIRGTGANPIIDGALKTTDARMESPITGMRVRQLRSLARFDGSRLVFSQISGVTDGGGTISGRGSFDFSLGVGVGIDLALQADKAELLDRDDIGAVVTGPITIRSNGKGGEIGGDFDVIRSRFTLGRAAEIAQIPELRLIERNSRASDFAPAQRGTTWLLNMKANARNRLMVQGMGLSSEWRMDLDIKGNVADPILLGRADLVRGSYDFAGRRFDLTSGTLRFDGSVPANPRLDITAEASISDLDATIRITGTSAAPEIAFTSTPAMPQEELLSRLLFGSSITQLSAPEALQLASAVGSLQGGGGLDPINAVRKAAGLDRLRILPADPTTGQNTSIGVGKYVTRKIYVELITDGQGYSATRLEYQVTRWLSLLSSISTLGRQSAAVRVSKDY